MNKHGAVGVKNISTGEVTYCAEGDVGAGYGTLCGNSLADDLLAQVQPPPRQRIDCPMCKSTWELARRFKTDDFVRN